MCSPQTEFKGTLSTTYIGYLQVVVCWLALWRKNESCDKAMEYPPGASPPVYLRYINGMERNACGFLLCSKEQVVVYTRIQCVASMYLAVTSLLK